MNFTVTSKGRQFDRLGLMYLGDIEVFRTSTAEPTANGIVWTYIKEMEQYNPLWATEQKLIFDLGNLIDDTYTGTFNTTLTATFSTIPTMRTAADQILPISAKRSATNGASAFSVPGDNASVAYTIPRNAERAVVSLSACGQATEEFWYTNVFSTEVDTFDDTIGTLYGYSPFREVQLLIDGQLAGVVWPIPVIFTGGIVPGLWRPIVSFDAFDLREREIDVTPWLPILCNGAPHRFEIRVVGIDDDGRAGTVLSNTVGSTWIVTGKIFLFLGPEGSTTSGEPPRIDTPLPTLKINSELTLNSTGSNETLQYETSATRSISITSTIKTSNGSVYPASWTQMLSYTNRNTLSSQGLTQDTFQNTAGKDQSSSGYVNDYSYTLQVTSTFSTPPSGGFGISASLSEDMKFQTYGPSIFPSGVQTFDRTSPKPVLYFFSGHGSKLTALRSPFPPKQDESLPGSTTSAHLNGSASYLSAGNASYSFGSTEETFTFHGAAAAGDPTEGTTFEDYFRSVKAVNASVVSDMERLSGYTVPSAPLLAAAESDWLGLVGQQAARESVKEILGRGPGRGEEMLVQSGKS